MRRGGGGGGGTTKTDLHFVSSGEECNNGGQLDPVIFLPIPTESFV